MELTGRAQKDFWTWYLLPENRVEYKTSALASGEVGAKVHFVASSFAERYGVYMDWFWSIGGSLRWYDHGLGDYGEMITIKVQGEKLWAKASYEYMPSHKDRREYLIKELNEMCNLR